MPIYYSSVMFYILCRVHVVFYCIMYISIWAIAKWIQWIQAMSCSATGPWSVWKTTPAQWNQSPLGNGLRKLEKLHLAEPRNLQLGRARRLHLWALSFHFFDLVVALNNFLRIFWNSCGWPGIQPPIRHGFCHPWTWFIKALNANLGEFLVEFGMVYGWVYHIVRGHRLYPSLSLAGQVLNSPHLPDRKK